MGPPTGDAEVDSLHDGPDVVEVLLAHDA
jgi:hypothetical protein